ncbi:hypothetical protein Smic_79830 [Streptomyces microflavus]|uniref:Mycothiol-dependent maleylpyruvate isomerase metal-binding domain-containing protein n=1 Tax=Streptomyces microflavus TaxID=1919 RepID=A0A7J0D5V1_STRMI|nr:hypothetical protein Smic_79830 [Streptomyces microflavus]
MPGLRHHIHLRAEWLPDELLRAVERADGRDLLHEERWSRSPWRLPSSCCRPDVEGCWSSEWNPHAVAAAPSLDVQVPTCPEWTLFDLVQHLGEGRRAWAATIAAGPDATSKSARRATRPCLGNVTPSSPWASRSRCRTRWHSTVSRSS